MPDANNGPPDGTRRALFDGDADPAASPGTAATTAKPALGSDAAAPEAGPGKSSGPPHRRRARIARTPIVVAVAVVLVVGILVGNQGPAPTVTAVPAVVEPSAAPAAAISSSWFCAGATDTRKGGAPGQLVIANAGGQALTATITLVPSKGERRTKSVRVGADDKTIVAETVPGGAPWIGAAVDMNGGAATVEQRIVSNLGTAIEPCATAGSTSWYFADAATRINASSVITLFNPYPTAAIANFTFTTNEGVETPGAFQGVGVHADSVVTVDLGSHLRRRTRIATSIGVTAGRLVAWQTDIVDTPPKGTPYVGTKAARQPDADPASPVLGVTETLGAPGVSTSWYWPQGSTASGLNEAYTVYNPSGRTAYLNLAFSLTQGSAEPFPIEVGPEQVFVLTATDQTRVPAGASYSVSLKSTNGVGVVAARTVSAQAPSSARGIGELIGAQTPDERWLVGSGLAGKHLDEQVVVSNPTTQPVTVSADSIAGGQSSALPGLTVQLGAGAQTTWDLGALHPSPAGSVLVTATGPIVVGVTLLGRHHRAGVSLSLGVPLAP